jgi:hypothetical protein
MATSVPKTYDLTVPRQPLNEPPLIQVRIEHVLGAFEDIDAGTPHLWTEPTKYEVLHNGKRYAAKAVVGLAYRRMAGKWPAHLSAGPLRTQAQGLLESLGLRIVEKSDAPPPREDWSPEEVHLIVEDYFLMLREELLDRAYNKAERRRRLLPKLRGRSEQSVEYKHANLSAVLLELGLPYIRGYKPRGNYQALLAETVGCYLVAQPNFFEGLMDGPVINPIAGPRLVGTTVAIFDDPPEETFAPPEPVEPWKSRRGRKNDVAQRDAANRRLGRMGEEFIVELEKQRLTEAGRDDLAARVEWVADTCGDGLGFDILSFSYADDSERYVEAKTTGLGKYAPFIVTANEVRCSEAEPMKFHLYRLYDFGQPQTRAYVLPGRLSQHCQLMPLNYRAVVGVAGTPT